MSDIEAQITRLWTPDGFRDDDWTHAESAEALAGNARVIVPLTAYLAMDEGERAAAASRLGVHVLPGEAIEPLLPHLGVVALISLVFPAFSDGRSYSKAELLRSRHDYRGVVRASGDVLIDQIPLMLRTGFTEFEVSNTTALRRLEEGRIGGLSVYYQPTAKPAAPGVGYSWRRLPAA